LEGNYEFHRWCNRYGHPKSYNELKQQNPSLSNEELDSKWNEILYKFDEFSKTRRSGVITPQSFGPNLKKG
jgi:hypothetical protein